jgi:hypothetical protein
MPPFVIVAMMPPSTTSGVAEPELEGDGPGVDVDDGGKGRDQVRRRGTEIDLLRSSC